MYREFEAQIKRVIQAGIQPDHLNGQVHIHFLPYVFPIVLSLAKKYKIKYVRVPLEPLTTMTSLSNYFKWFILQSMGLLIRIQTRLPRNAPTFFGILHTSDMSLSVIQKIITKDHQNPIEVLTHPGLHDLGESKFSFSKQGVDDFLLSNNRILELETLLNPGLLSYIKVNNIKLVNFKNLSK